MKWQRTQERLQKETLREGGKMRRRRSSLDRGRSYTAFLIACRTQQPLYVGGGRKRGRERGREGGGRFAVKEWTETSSNEWNP